MINYLTWIDVNIIRFWYLQPVKAQMHSCTQEVFANICIFTFSLKNALAIFQHFMGKLLQDVAGKHVGTYIGNIIIKTHTFKGHKEKVKQVMEKLGEVGWMINLKKSKFLHSKVSYLGFELSADGLRPGLNKVKAVEEFPAPHHVKTVHRFQV